MRSSSFGYWKSSSSSRMRVSSATCARRAAGIHHERAGAQARTTGPRPREIIISTFHLPSPDAPCCTCVCARGEGWQRPADRPVAACWGAAHRKCWGHDSRRQKSSSDAPSAEAQGSRGRRCWGGGADRAARCRGCFRSCGHLRAGARFFLILFYYGLWSGGGLGFSS